MGRDGEAEVVKMSSVKGLNSSLFISTLRSPLAGREYYCEFTVESISEEVKFDVIGNNESLTTSSFKGTRQGDNLVIGSIIQGDYDKGYDDIVPEFTFHFPEQWATYKATYYTLSTTESTLQIILHVTDVYFSGRRGDYWIDDNRDILEVTVKVAGSTTQYKWQADGMFGYQGQEDDFLFVFPIYMGLIISVLALFIAVIVIAAVRGKMCACCRIN
eukprot:sb/3470003/